jgi:sulfatase maturation enzyme AslB (radical SAM superfamily)
MVYTALTALLARDGLPPFGVVVTAVLPGGCQLNCPFCIVNQRGERQEHSNLSTDHLTTLLASVERNGLLGGAAIVGDEPLQSHCWPMAKAFLGRALECKVPTAMITNGYNLVDFAEELRRLSSTKFVVSLDAANSEHDEIRRKPGAFARISEGLELATSYPDLRERLSIATILMPGNLSAISEIIDFTARLKIPQLLLSPLLTSSRTTPLVVHPRIMRDAWTELPALLKRANSAGVKLRISDEFGVLGQWNDKLASAEIDIVSPSEPARLIRIDAAGRLETLATMQAGTTTGLHLPTDINEMDTFVATLAERCFDTVAVAA